MIASRSEVESICGDVLDKRGLTREFVSGVNSLLKGRSRMSRLPQRPVLYAPRRVPPSYEEQAFLSKLWDQWRLWRKHLADNERRGRPNVAEGAPPKYDDTDRLVFADWLGDRGDPREVIARQAVPIGFGSKTHEHPEGLPGYTENPDSYNYTHPLTPDPATHRPHSSNSFMSMFGPGAPGYRQMDFSKDLIHPGVSEQYTKDDSHVLPDGWKQRPAIVWRHAGITTNRYGGRREREHPVMFYAPVTADQYHEFVDKHVTDPAKKEQWLAVAKKYNWNRSAPEAKPMSRLSRKVVKYAMAEQTRHPAHESVAGHPLDFFLQKMANDPENSDTVRNLAAHSRIEPSALYGLDDEMQDTNHKWYGYYNLKSAADALNGIDAHTLSALKSEAENSKTGVHPSVHHAWAYTPEHHATNASLGIDATKQMIRSNVHQRANHELRNRIHQRVTAKMPGVSPKEIDESIKRHAHRGNYLLVTRNPHQPGSERNKRLAEEYRQRALLPRGELMATEAPSRYRRKNSNEFRVPVSAFLGPVRYTGEHFVPKPVLNEGTWFVNHRGEEGFNHDYFGHNGTRLGNVMVVPRDKGETLHVAWMGGKVANPGHMRHVMKQLVGMYPTAKWVTGHRVSGFRTDMPMGQQEVRRKIPGRNSRRVVVRYNRKAFDAAIDADPMESTNHAVYADWLEENGDPKEAAFRRSMGEWIRNGNLEHEPGHEFPFRWWWGVTGNRWLDHNRGGGGATPHGVDPFYSSNFMPLGRVESHEVPRDQGVHDEANGFVRWRNYRAVERAMRNRFTGEDHSKLYGGMPTTSGWGRTGEGPFDSEKDATDFGHSEVGVPWRVVPEGGKFHLETRSRNYRRTVIPGRMERQVVLSPKKYAENPEQFRSWWMSPEGHAYEMGPYEDHYDWLKNNSHHPSLGPGGTASGLGVMGHAFSKGWVRLLHAAGELTAHNGLIPHMTQTVRRAVEDHARMLGARSAVFHGSHGEKSIRFSRGLSPKKYARLRTVGEYGGITDKFIHSIDTEPGGGGGAHHSFPPILADFLQDEDDPRHEILRRAHTRPNPTGSPWSGDPSWNVIGDHHIEGDWGGLTLSALRKAPTNPLDRKGGKKNSLAIRVWFPGGSNPQRGIDREAVATPEEARNMVDLVPDEGKKTAAHEFLDRYFGKKQPDPVQEARRYALKKRTPGDFLDALRRIRSKNNQALHEVARVAAQKLGL